MKRLRDVERPSRYKDLLRATARMQVRHPFLTLAALLVVTIFLVGGIQQVRTVASLEQMMPTDIEEIRAFRTLRDHGLGQDMLAVAIELDPDASVPAQDILAYRTYEYVRMLDGTLEGQDLVLAADSMADVIRAAGDPQDEAQYALIVANPEVQARMTQFVSAGQDSTIIIISTDVSADDTRMRLLALQVQDILASAGHPPGTRVSVTGTPMIQQRLGEVIEHDRSTTERLSALFVFLLVAIVFGSITAAFVPMASIILSVIWLYGAMGYAHLPISTLAGGVAAMVIGIGVDFSIHLRNKFEYERKKGESLAYAVEETMGNTGYVLTHVTAVTALAFLAFTLGQMPEMGRFGLLMAMGVTLAFLLSVIGLPALFIVEEKLIYWATTHLRFGVEHELTLAPAGKRARTNRKELGVRK